MSKNTYAAIDIGTNTFRLLIADIHFNPDNSRYSIKEICSERIITRLGSGITFSGLISVRSMQKGLEALKTFSRIIADNNVPQTYAVATSALREAKNSTEFILKAKELSGLDIKIISGDDEARFTASGMMLDMDVPDKAILIDIGGGSTELIFTHKADAVHLHSLNLGVVYLAATYMTDDPPSSDMINKMEEEIENVITSETSLFDRKADTGVRLIGTAGTITALAAMSLNLTSYDHNKIHKSRMSAETVRNIFQRIALVSSAERAQHIPFEPERLDIIVPGTLILLKLMELFRADEILVSDYGLREGILLEISKNRDNKR